MHESCFKSVTRIIFFFFEKKSNQNIRIIFDEFDKKDLACKENQSTEFRSNIIRFLDSQLITSELISVKSPTNIAFVR